MFYPVTTAPAYAVKRISEHLIEVKMKYKAGFFQPFLLTSDIHFDNPHCKRDLYYRHLDVAKSRNAGVFTFGDFFCLMQGKYDPRRSKSSVRPEHNVENYLDVVYSDSANQIAPWADQFILFSDGNHETSVLKNLETNPLDNLVEKLNLAHGGKAFRGNYQGFVRFRFEHESGGNVKTKLMFYHHGKWGGVISKGTQGVPRFAAIIPQADLVVTGHTHDKWVVEQPMFHMTESGELKIREQEHIKCSTYKEEFCKSKGFGPERIVMPKALGGQWLEFYFESGEIKTRIYAAK